MHLFEKYYNIKSETINYLIKVVVPTALRNCVNYIIYLLLDSKIRVTNMSMSQNIQVNVMRSHYNNVLGLTI